ncbi:MAG: glycine C-acetyltransferase [Proteobacteria bacterium]|nr:glycine C-acetyltransferase [Pseudomonadota bacterium]NCA28809.1 glycine C-acetyltransferase [Pseudomonadota bacterium]
MFKSEFLDSISCELEDLKINGLYKGEYEIASSQSSNIEIYHHNSKKKVLNFCANNYLGLANNKNLIEIAKKTLDDYGLGTASVRFICGTFDLHKKFEQKLAEFLNYEDVITFASCFSANGGVFASLLDENDAIISADLNHASLIDGIRLCKAHRYFYKYNDMAELEKKLQEASHHRNKMIVTDGVFSMDGDIAKLNEICDLAEKYKAILLVDDSHATGFIGENGRGTPEYCKVEGRVDILVSTLGKALGGAGGGFIASKKNVIEKLRNKARPYLFSNNILPIVCAVGIEIIDMILESKFLIKKLADNTTYFRKKIIEAGFVIHDPEGVHPVVPVMLGDAVLASKFAKMMIEDEGIYVIAFSFPVVPKNTARIRVQISSGHEKEHLDEAINAFIKVGKKLGVI